MRELLLNLVVNVILITSVDILGDGFCRTDKYDFGKHIVCAIMTKKEFLTKFSKERGSFRSFKTTRTIFLSWTPKKVINGVYVFLDGKKL